MSNQGTLKSEDMWQEGFLERLVYRMLPVSREGDTIVVLCTFNKKIPDLLSRSGIFARHHIVSSAIEIIPVSPTI